MAVTLLVLLIDASLNSRSPAPVQQLAAGTWVDRVLPVIDASTSEGQTIAALWANGLKTPATTIASQVTQVADQAAADYATVAKLRPPAELGGAAGLLEAALLARSQAATQLKSVFLATLGAAASAAPATPAAPAATPTSVGATPTSAGGATTSSTAAASPSTTAAAVPSSTAAPSSSSVPPSTAPAAAAPTTVPQVGAAPASQLPAIARAGSDIQVGDQAYQLFASSFPASVGVRMPPSQWAGDMAPYAPQAAQVYLASLQSATVTSPVNRVQIYAVSTTPAPVSSQGQVQVIPDTPDLTVTIVVADTGNQPESNVTVTAAVNPVGSGSSSVRDFVNLAPGQAYTIADLGPLGLPKGVPVTLTVTVTGPAGSPLPAATSSITLMIPAPPPPTSTTVPKK